MIADAVFLLSVGLSGVVSLILMSKTVLSSRKVVRIPVRMDEDVSLRRIDVRRS